MSYILEKMFKSLDEDDMRLLFNSRLDEIKEIVNTWPDPENLTAEELINQLKDKINRLTFYCKYL